jgi:arylformamidase
LFNFGWNRYWGSEEYQSYPFISRGLIEFLVKAGVKLVDVDTVNVDDSRDLTRPAHSLLLENEIFVVENLTNLYRLHGKDFRFFAVPLKGRRVTSMPVRAFAEIM